MFVFVSYSLFCFGFFCGGGGGGGYIQNAYEYDEKVKSLRNILYKTQKIKRRGKNEEKGRREGGVPLYALSLENIGFRPNKRRYFNQMKYIFEHLITGAVELSVI